MSKILVVAGHKSGNLKDSSKELLGFASGLGAEVSAVVIGSGVSTVADEAAGQGAATVYVADDASLEVYSTALYTGLVVDAAQQSGATQIWLTSTEIGRDLTPRVAARLDVGALSDVTKLEVNGEHITAYRPCMATKLVQEVRFKHDGIRVLSIRAGSFEVIEKAPTSANAVSLALPEADSRLEPLGVEVEVSNEISLNEAPIVVSVGRGAGGPDGCESVRPLAQQMGAAFGASRAVCDAGWLPHKHQVGQTGTQVKPNLYVALGISGAIQHLAGMSGSKTIVAVNKDPDAPIFKVADYGIVGDLFKAVPVMQEEVAKLKA